MSVLGRLLISSAQRLDLPDLLSIDSYAAGDFKYLIQGLVGDNKPYIIKGFDVINPGDAIGSQNISVKVADSVVLYPSSSAGPFFHGLSETHPQAQPLVPELKKNATNYVYLTFSTFNTASDTRAFWDVDANGGTGAEFTQDVNTESVLKVDIGVSSSAFPDNTIPVCKVTVGPTVITKIEDCRDLMFRLGSGGVNPNPFSQYNFRSLPSASYKRTEPPTSISTALAPNPFQGADKNTLSLKEWMDMVMTKLLELGGSTFWYEDTSTYNLINIFQSVLGTSFKSKGQWIHSSVTPGLLTWTEDITLKSTADLRDVIIRAGNKTLADEQIAYIQLVRNENINGISTSVSWTNASNTVNSVIGAFQNLTKGDWIKKKNDPNNRYLRVEEFYANTNLGGGATTAANARSIKLSSTYTGTTEDALAGYTKGVYTGSDITVANRNDNTVQSLGGNAYWLAIRSDTIQNISGITSYTVTGTISGSSNNGASTRVLSPAHGLVDGDRITIASGPYTGTHMVEVEDTDIFFLKSTYLGDVAITAYYAIATTTTRSTADGLLLESAAHNFNDNDTIAIANTSSSFDGSYLIKKRSTTSFSVPVGSAIPSVSTGTATLAKIVIRTDFNSAEIIQGQTISIGDEDSTNILSYIGMQSPSQTAPIYTVPPTYNALHGMQDYNSSSSDNLTARVSKLTAMMATKAQDKTCKYLPSNIISISNTTNGSAQEVTFNTLGGSPTLTIARPGSPGNTLIFLPTTAPGISLLANQVAYVNTDRNTANTASITITNINQCPINETIFVIAVRLSSTDIWLWDGSIITIGTIPVPSYLPKIVRQNFSAKLINGGTWDWDLTSQTLTWSSSANIQISGLTDSVNNISAGSTLLAANEVAYVELNRTSPGGTLTVNVSSISSLIPTDNTMIIARRIGSSVLIGETILLVDLESKVLYAGMSDQNLTYIGATGEADDTPDYTSITVSSGSLVAQDYNSTVGESLTSRLAKVTAMLADNKQDFNIVIDPGSVTWDGSNISITNAKLSIPGTTIGALPVSINNYSSAPLADNECLYIDISRTSGSALTLAVLSLSALVPAQQRLVVARRLGTDIFMRAS